MLNTSRPPGSGRCQRDRGFYFAKSANLSLWQGEFYFRFSVANPIRKARHPEHADGRAPRYRDDEIVFVVVAYGETLPRERLKAAGGRWNPTKKHGKSSTWRFGATPNWKTE
jgi:hypothetical protein